LKKSKTKDQTENVRDCRRVEIDQIKGQIKKNLMFDGQLKVQVHKLKTKNQDKNGAELWG